MARRSYPGQIEKYRACAQSIRQRQGRNHLRFLSTAELREWNAWIARLNGTEESKPVRRACV